MVLDKEAGLGEGASAKSAKSSSTFSQYSMASDVGPGRNAPESADGTALAGDGFAPPKRPLTKSAILSAAWWV